MRCGGDDSSARTSAGLGPSARAGAASAAWRNLDDVADPQLRQRIATALLDADSDAAMTGQLTLAEAWPLVSE
ncbi:hypothetical protein ABZX60_18685 [Streptomyces olivaceus]|uniref:hypothetical protein n=1 Tax=Streptomyces olivaceus TaxID=47716 RepID=UPI0018A7EA1F|nr:hypothetical protein [Streptomyces olivaceus]MBF8173350.1 hypothetical protein [Streptomyces olivaceus]MBZ6232625.1 hypothetical protein [Streptomyces olivaceus]